MYYKINPWKLCNPPGSYPESLRSRPIPVVEIVDIDEANQSQCDNFSITDISDTINVSRRSRNTLIPSAPIHLINRTEDGSEVIYVQVS
jgi:hypothetical protein